MKRSLFRMVCLALCLILTLSLLPYSNQAKASEIQRSGYQDLTDIQKRVYDAMAEAVANCRDKVTFDKEDGIVQEDLQAVSKAICGDYPEYFWYTGDYTFTIVNNTDITEMIPKYFIGETQVTAQSTELTDAKTAFDAKVSQILGAMTARSEYEKALYLHDQVAAAVTYAAGGDDQTAYGALVTGKAVCAGYVRAYQHLLNQVGIQNRKIDGTGIKADGSQEAHSWNLLWLDGKCCYVDVTWDDQGQQLYHTYFGRSLEEISKDHIASAGFDAVLPECGHAGMDYFTYTAGNGVCVITDKTSVQMAADSFLHEKLSDGSDVFRCSFWYNGDMNSWLQNNAQAIADKLGFQGTYQYSGANLGNEYQIVFTGNAVSQTQPTQPIDDGDTDEVHFDGLLGILLAVAGGVILLVIVVILVSRKKK